MAMPGCPPFVLCTLSFFSGAVLSCVVLVHGQPQTGFISIDCGVVDGPGYTDKFTNIHFSPDAQYVDAGESKSVPAPGLTAQYRDLRSFPTGRRNCYRLWPVQRGGRYLIRAGFWYNNYDGNNTIPEFDLHIGANFWATVDLSSPDGGGTEEIIAVALAESIWVCLVNTGKGTPFISTLELRPLLPFQYVRANASHSLVLLQDRRDYGANEQLRYNKDPYDRIWFGYPGNFRLLNSTAEVTIGSGDAFQVPSTVLRTAATTDNNTVPINITIWQTRSPGDELYVVLHFAEVEQLMPNETRRMDIYEGLDTSGRRMYANYSPPYLQADALEVSATTGDDGTKFLISIFASASSTRPPAIGATEIFILRPMNVSSTNQSDVDAIQDIKGVYQVKRNWMGDPCAPQEFTWEGLNCSHEASTPPRITHLNLTSSGLSDGIPASIANLTALTTLDLSNNNLTGTVPEFLAGLPSLGLLVLTGNQFTGTIPHQLCAKAQNSALSLRIEGYPGQCSQVTSKKKTLILVALVTSVGFAVLLVISILLWRIKRRRQVGASKEISKKQHEEDLPRNMTKDIKVFKAESYHFTFPEIINITKNFKMAIGKGGFGTVYLGYLNDGTRVAVKVLSRSSSQGIKEFQAEVLLLTRVHHRHLVSLLGYCDDEDNPALVYEYMDKGNLRDHLSGNIDNINVLSWEQRVKIALQAAQGLDYLHNGCKPPILHRDVKSANILLNHDYVAKLADFGLSRAFNSGNLNPISTKVAGTPGYLDPECHRSHGLNEKSDVYGFGIVLLEILTGQPPFPNCPETTHIVQWVQSRLECGDLSSIVDPRLHGLYDTNSPWKVIEIAMSCTSIVSAQRLSMGNVVSQLKECLGSEVVGYVFDGFDIPNSNPTGTLPSAR